MIGPRGGISQRHGKSQAPPPRPTLKDRMERVVRSIERQNGANSRYSGTGLEVWMSARRISSTVAITTVLAFAVPAFAQTPANAPKNATAQCTDGTFSTAKTEEGACSKH